jgi:isocitrate dehydrogenase
VPDNLAELGKLTLKPEANIIKLPNISASVAQLKAAIKELQDKGYKIPDFPRSRRPTRKGHPRPLQQVHRLAVNPVLREGNSDRRAPRPSRIRPQEPAQHGRVEPGLALARLAHAHGDFYHGEKSMTLDRARDVKMELITKSGKTIVLKPKVSLLDRESSTPCS